MWELIEFINGAAVVLGVYSDFGLCSEAAEIRTYLNDGMARVICAASL